MLDTAFFYFFAFLTLAGGVFTITRRSPMHSAISLIVSLLGVAGIFLLQNAPFLFAVQIILYVGGIMVLFLFVIMLVNLDIEARERHFNKQWLLALVAVVAVAAEIGFFFRRPLQLPASAVGPAAKNNVEQVADLLFSQYLLPFEVASVLLLAAVIGSVVMAKKRV